MSSKGALNKVTAFAKLNGEPMTTALAQQVLGDFIADRQPRPITVDMILDATVEQFGFSKEELIGKSRRRPLVIARQMAMYVTRELTDLSFPLIAREFGGRDHTTVMHACDKISALMKERSQIYNHVMTLDKAVRGNAQVWGYLVDNVGLPVWNDPAWAAQRLCTGLCATGTESRGWPATPLSTPPPNHIAVTGGEPHTPSGQQNGS